MIGKVAMWLGGMAFGALLMIAVVFAVEAWNEWRHVKKQIKKRKAEEANKE